MPFRPTINATVAISAQEYIFQEHPAAKGMVYGQSGKRATVYQLRNSQGELFALKVFIPAFRTPETEQSAVKLATFADLPGLQVCTRLVLSEQNNPQLLQTAPELAYAVLMPWVQGHTWYDILSTRKPFEPNQSITTARAFVNMLSTIERNGLAHCDLSSANVLVYNFVEEGFPLLALVDVEDMFGPGFGQPSDLPGGTSGYGHRTSKQGQWNAFSDRFAGAVLLAEMLCWFDPNIRQAAEGEQFFSQSEMQTDSPRYSLMLKVLETRWGNEVAGLFLKAWESQTLDQCPAFSEWAEALSRAEQHFVAIFRNAMPASAARVNSTEQSTPVALPNSGFQSPPQTTLQPAPVSPKSTPSITGSNANAGLDRPPQKPKSFSTWGLAAIGLVLLCVGVGAGVFAAGIIMFPSVPTRQPIVALGNDTSLPSALASTSVPPENISNPTSTIETIALDFCKSSNENICIYTFGGLSGKMVITLEIKDQSLKDLYIKTGNGIFYFCSQLPEYPDRLYCTGPTIKEGTEITISVYLTSGDKILATGAFNIPNVIIAPTPKPTKKSGGGGYP